MDEQPVQDAWPEGVWLARHYADSYGMTLPQAISLAYGRPAGEAGWISGPCPLSNESESPS